MQQMYFIYDFHKPAAGRRVKKSSSKSNYKVIINFKKNTTDARVSFKSPSRVQKIKMAVFGQCAVALVSLFKGRKQSLFNQTVARMNFKQILSYMQMHD